MPVIERRSALKALVTAAAGFFWTACRQIAGDSLLPAPTLARVEDIQATGAAHAQVTPSATVVGEDTVVPSATPENDMTPSGAASDAEAKRHPVERGPDGVLVTAPIARFYENRYRNGSPRPEIDRDGWQLTIEGWVESPQALTFEALEDLTPVEQMRTLECISNPVGGPLIGNTIWRGVRLADVLALAEVRTGAREIKMTAADGYQTSIPVEVALHPDALLVYEMNGEPLPVKHGYPARVLLPGRYGQKQPKWITTIEAITAEFLGYWETTGWSNECLVQINSQIWEPQMLETVAEGEVTLQGIAFADSSGVARVEVSLDGGTSWEEAELIPGPSNYVWTEWRYVATLSAARSPYSVVARATDGTGVTQRDRQTENSLLGGTFPDGTSNLHRIVVNAS